MIGVAYSTFIIVIRFYSTEAINREVNLQCTYVHTYVHVL